MLIAILILVVFGISTAACSFYFKFASVHGPYSIPNYRSLHQKVIPRGAGIAVDVATLLAFLGIYFAGFMENSHGLVFCLGGTLIAIAGYADDRYDIAPKYRLMVQFAGAIWVSLVLKGFPPLDLGFIKINLGMAGSVLYVLACIWFYNLYNFIDGIDGLAATSAIFICGSMGVFLGLQHEYLLATILWVIACASAGFLLFNWPPAKMFLGESGTAFISYSLSGIILITLWKNPANLWLWLIICAYYFADTTTTTTIRALTLPDWYKPHRSHAYQNLARVWASHLKVLRLVLGINFLWLTPLAVTAYLYPRLAPFAVLVAYLPIVLFCIKFGPLYQNK